MTDVKERYLHDPVFHQAVEMMRSFLRDAHLAPSEVREAAMLACIIEEERRQARADWEWWFDTPDFRTRWRVTVWGSRRMVVHDGIVECLFDTEETV